MPTVSVQRGRGEVNRLSRMVLLGGALLAVLWTGLPSFSGSPGDAKRPTYTLTGFEITYPYDDPRADIGPSLEVAGVSFVVHWPSGEYPGEADCQIGLTAASGQTVGTLDFGLNSASDGRRGAPMEITVDGVPVSAKGNCAPGAPYLPGPGYLFEGPTRIASPVDPITGEALPNRTELTFKVSWEQSNMAPGYRLCHLIVSRTDGSEDQPVTFGFLVGEGAQTINVEGAPETVQGARVACRPLR
jgi:hypothetical protein